KAAIRVASVNIKGWKAKDAKQPKWYEIDQVMREKRVGILITQEAHMDDKRRETVENLFKKSLKVFSSADPENPTGKGGVAIVLNRKLTNVNAVKTFEIIPGRALLLQTNWHRAEKITVLGVYAPNDAEENAEFWEKIEAYFDAHPNVPKPDIMGGDCNMVEDAIDRLPMHEDKSHQVDALDSLKNKFNFKDGWRDTYPTLKAFTFHQIATGSQSRIDRMYVTPRILATAREWRIEIIGISTDHKMVSVQVASENAPNVGKGRWAIPQHIIKDKTLTQYIKDRGLDAKSKLDTMGERTEEYNPQTIYTKFKREVLEMARHREKIAVPKIILKQRNLESTLERINNDENTPEDEKIQAAAEINVKLANLEKERHTKARVATATRNRIEGETMCKYWPQSNKEAKPRDTIYALRKPGGVGENPDQDVYEKDSQKMAELARNYHEELQVDHNPPEKELRDEKIQKVLENISTRTTDQQFETMRRKLLEEDVAEALKHSQNNKAAGLDGATYELWKTIHARYIEDVRCGRTAFNLIGLMTKAFNNIEEFGVVASTNFSEGWMCPIYKKNDRNEVANYRPITLLNTDYKIMTKALAMKL
ncbi:Endonuclease/exonuclease/phosphatase, partial [Mycena crocata]